MPETTDSVDPLLAEVRAARRRLDTAVTTLHELRKQEAATRSRIAEAADTVAKLRNQVDDKMRELQAEMNRLRRA